MPLIQPPPTYAAPFRGDPQKMAELKIVFEPLWLNWFIELARSLNSGGGTGLGTVTQVSATGANGIGVSIASATTTPALSLSLGTVQPATGYKAVDGSTGVSGTANATNTLTIKNGLVTNIA